MKANMNNIIRIATFLLLILIKSSHESDETDFDKIKKTSVLWKLDGLRKHDCTKQIIGYIRDMKKIWNSYEKENSDGKF